MNDFSNPLLSARQVSKHYMLPTGTLPILHGLDLIIGEGEAICVMGSSGAGKSTLLHILGTLDRPSSGAVHYRGESLFSKGDDWLAKFRSQKMGFVFQFHHLLGEFTALENVMMPSRIAGESARDAKRKAESLLDELNVLHRKNHYPSELSGGEQQRVAIARALVRAPEILFADEPTGNLDSQNGQKIQELFFDLKMRRGLTLVVVTHDSEFARRFPKVLTMKDGRWVDIKQNTLTV